MNLDDRQFLKNCELHLLQPALGSIIEQTQLRRGTVGPNVTRDDSILRKTSQSPDFLHNRWNAILGHLLTKLIAIESQQIPAARFQVVISAIIERDAFGIGVPGVAIGFDVEVPFGTIEGEIERIVRSVGRNKFLTLGIEPDPL